MAVQAGATILGGLIAGLFSEPSGAGKQREARLAAQREEFMQRLDAQRLEAERQKRIAEAKRLQGMFDRLTRTMKLNRLPELRLKGLDAGSALQLKGMAETSGYGIPGLPGIHTHGARSETGSPVADAAAPSTDLSKLSGTQLADLVASLPEEEQENLIRVAEATRAARMASSAGPIATEASSSEARAPSLALSQLGTLERPSPDAVHASSGEAAAVQATRGFDTPGTGTPVDLSGARAPLVVQSGDVSGAAPAAARVPHVVTVPPPVVTYRPSGVGLIGGTGWIYGFNLPPNSERAAERTEALRAVAVRRLQEQMTLAGLTPRQQADFLKTNSYNFILAVAASHDKGTDLFRRVGLGDEISEGQFSAEQQTLYASLKGRQFDRLDCHSNGAMVCLAALSRGDVATDHVRLLGPQVTGDALEAWRGLKATGRVKTVEIFINRGDPIPAASYIGGSLSDIVSHPLPTSRFAEAILERITRGAEELPVTILSFCPEARSMGFDLSFACHDAARYQKLISDPAGHR